MRIRHCKLLRNRMYLFFLQSTFVKYCTQIYVCGSMNNESLPRVVLNFTKFNSSSQQSERFQNTSDDESCFFSKAGE